MKSVTKISKHIHLRKSKLFSDNAVIFLTSLPILRSLNSHRQTLPPTFPLLFNPFSRPSLSTSQTVPNMRVTNPRPWLPSRGTECQFKCCHTCRPTLLDRSFLSLNAILNDDLPCTAVTGFGFNLQKFRPVAKVEIVKNLGLRPNPVPLELNPSRSRSRNLRYQKRAANLGLGILTHRSNATLSPNNPNYNSSPSPTHTCNPHPARNSFPRSDFFSNSPSFIPGSFPISSETTSTSTESSTYPFPYIAMPAPTYQSNNIVNPFKSTNSNIPQNHAVLIPLPPQTPSEVSLLATPTPTLMEESESDGHFFGAEPLEVEDGVAVMEEGVGLHVPDVLITQY
ncbi:123eb86c-0117-453f-b26b-56979e4a637f [Sclerotinia trifoliorum]|uniref:123eb86c-0117-453f-b26b-56979e4a637f n=1 Tax=Sclerotinia trifoliorum TaxID=28548 RepID=A0A8H2ZPS7_9HELO|nr:123eb86c-0117-453f-b26b-56979e4a637f [Sclerotinia trifoliorum]